MQSLKDLAAHVSQLKQPIDKQCDIHGCQMYLNKMTKKEECGQCVQEAINVRTDAKVLDMQKDALKAKTYHVLESKSILTDESLRGVSFERSEVSATGEQRNNFRAGYKAAKEYLEGGNRNMLLFGNTGAGKSHLAMCILQEVNEKSEPYRQCLFVSTDELIRLIQSTFNNPYSEIDEYKIVDLIKKVDLLVLDDLGAEIGLINSSRQSSDYSARILTAILNGRQTKPTIVTSNLTLEDINRKYDKRIVSRLLKGAALLEFKETKDQRMLGVGG